MNSKQWDALAKAEQEWDAGRGMTVQDDPVLRITGEIWDALTAAERWELLWRTGITQRRGPDYHGHKTGERNWHNQWPSMQRKIATVITCIDCTD